MRKFVCYSFVFLCMKVLLPASESGMTGIQKEKLTGYLTQLVAMNTVTDHQEGNLNALKWVEQQLDSIPLQVKYYTFNGHPSCVITTRKTIKPTVWLVAHIDVVPGEDFLFKPKIENHKMFGRGAYDMKMAIACYILLMHELKDEIAHYNIGIMLTSDEEIGGMNGVKSLLNEGYSSEVALLPDGGFNWNFEEEAKGVLHVKISSEGRSAHSSRPWEGDNAINHLIEPLRDINTYFEEEKSKHETYYSTANLGLIQGGKGINQVPSYAEAKLDIRFPASTNANQLFEDMQDLIKKYPQVSLNRMIEGAPNKVDLSHPFFQKFRSIAHEMYGIQVGSVRSHGSSDARFFGERKIPVLVISCMGGDIHSDKEWIDLDDLVRFYEVLKKWVIEVSHDKTS